MIYLIGVLVLLVGCGDSSEIGQPGDSDSFIRMNGCAHAERSVVTQGWRCESFPYHINSPYDLEISDRHGYDRQTNTHEFLIKPTDKLHVKTSKTFPRTEMRWRNEYTAGRHMFEADVYIEKLTHASIVQLHRLKPKDPPATEIMLRMQMDHTLRYYNRQVVASDILRRWFNLKVMHDAEEGQILVWVNDELRLDTTDNGEPHKWYFNNGVYLQSEGKPSGIVKMRDVTYWRQ